jgi:hypothetical protein
MEKNAKVIISSVFHDKNPRKPESPIPDNSLSLSII